MTNQMIMHGFYSAGDYYYFQRYENEKGFYLCNSKGVKIEHYNSVDDFIKNTNLKEFKEIKPKKPKPKKKTCEHKNIIAEFMGNGFLHKCADCGETMYDFGKK